MAKIEINDLQRLRAERARDNYLRFIQYVFTYIYRKPFRTNWHHGYICEHLEAVRMRQLRRILFNMPPRYSKSELVTIVFDPYLKGHNPKLDFLSTSYSGDLAKDHAKQGRDIILDPAYQLVFPKTQIKKGSQEKADWQTTDDGRRIAVGVGGSITGRGGDVLVWDDPHKPKSMDSDVTRRADINWYKNTFYSRLNDKKRGAIVGVMQRVHDDDLSGHVLETEEDQVPYQQIIIASDCPEPQTYVYGNFRYERKAGELIWPDFEDQAEINDMKKTMRDYYASQYNQDPIPEGDRYFKEEGFVPYDFTNGPEKQGIKLVKYGGSDFAITEGGGDWTVHEVWGVDKDGVWWFLDIWREQTESDKWVESWIALQRKHRTRAWFPEDGQIKKTVGPFARTEFRRKKVNINIFPINPDASQAARARSFQGWHNMGMCRYPVNAPWWPNVLKEMQRFPKGKHTDTIDPMSLIALGMEEIRGAKMPRGEKPKPGWRETKLRKFIREQRAKEKLRERGVEI